LFFLAYHHIPKIFQRNIPKKSGVRELSAETNQEGGTLRISQNGVRRGLVLAPA
jgi:hypothetical protein